MQRWAGLAVATVLIALAGCSEATVGEARATPSSPTAEATATPSATPSRAAHTPAPVATPTKSQEQIEDEAYTALAASRGKESIGGVQSGINLGRTFCENLRANYAADPATSVGSLIENEFSRDPSAIEVFCPEFVPALRLAETGFYDGRYAVGVDIAAGTYTTIVTPGAAGVSDCYWERTTGAGETIDNDFVSLAPQGVTVTVRDGEGFVSEGCGAWLPS